MPRAFVAIDIDEYIRQKLVAAQKQLTTAGADIKLVEPENVHVTMKFLGDVPDNKVAAVVDAIRTAVAGTQPFEMKIRGIGAFPNMRYIRVIWAGVADGRDVLIELERKIDRELQKLGFPPERDFVPHLTLARVRTPRRKEQLAATIEGMTKDNTEFGDMRAQAVELKQSQLISKGPIYSTIARIELG
jgi:2'-5' RNA ligase